jgi:hypothetical protein
VLDSNTIKVIAQATEQRDSPYANWLGIWGKY